ncbi:MAG: DUF3168 domain-containing protein [Pseudomonadota bacterium]
MSYAVASALQSAIFDALRADAALGALVGSGIFDAVPSGAAPDLYVLIGAETVRASNDKTGTGARHQLEISVVSDAPGFSAAKAAAGAVCDVLDRADLSLSRGRLVYLNFDRATAQRSDGAAGRTIDLRFVARVEDT